MKAIFEQPQMTNTEATMRPSRLWRIAVAAGVIVAGGVGWYLFRPELLFVDRTVNEALPTASMARPTSGSATEPFTLATGMFHKGVHETKGSATIHQLSSETRVLRLTGFETSNGPDVHVYLVAAHDAVDNDTVKAAGFIDLGSLKGNVGDQNYDIPAEVDLSKYRAVTIWCARFGVNFGTAPLSSSTAGAVKREPTTLVAGSFHKGAHETRGTAAILQLDNGSRVLRLTDFATSNGPDVRVYLVATNDAVDSETVNNTEHIEVGKLKGNVGDQNYELPDDVDLNKYRAVTIWCARFGVNFGTAPLK
jgi:hypothetical protein